MTSGSISKRRFASVLSYLLVFASLISALLFLSLREGSEKRTDHPMDPASRALTSPELIEGWRNKQLMPAQSATPLAEVSLSTGDGERVNRTTVCLPTSKDTDEASKELSSIEAVWLRVSGGPKEIIAAHPMSAITAPPQSRYGLTCLDLPPMHLEAGERGGDYIFFLSGAQHDDANAWLKRDALHIISVTAPVISPGEWVAIFMMFLAMLLRIYAWNATPSKADPASLPWRSFDAFMASSLLFMLWGLSTALIGKEPDSALQMGLLLQAPLLTYIIIPHLIAMRRHETVSTALALVRPARFGVLLPLGGGVLIALASIGLLKVLPQPSAISHYQEMTWMPGGAFAILFTSILLSWFEEHFWRGFFFGALESTRGAIVATVITVFFHLLLSAPQHYGYLWPLLPLGLMSIAACWLRAKTRSSTSSFALNLGFRVTFAAMILMGGFSANLL